MVYIIYMNTHLPIPLKGAIIYEDTKLYACLANEPIVNGHTVVVWKDPVPDLHLLNTKEYEYLMDRVEKVRNAMLKALHIEKVYLVYMDEIRQVHWHLIPRYNEKGYNVFCHAPTKLTDVSFAKKIKDKL